MTIIFQYQYSLNLTWRDLNMIFDANSGESHGIWVLGPRTSFCHRFLLNSFMPQYFLLLVQFGVFSCALFMVCLFFLSRRLFFSVFFSLRERFEFIKRHCGQIAYFTRRRICTTSIVQNNLSFDIIHDLLNNNDHNRQQTINKR